jgi:hypothetical protein
MNLSTSNFYLTKEPLEETLNGINKVGLTDFFLDKFF